MARRKNKQSRKYKPLNIFMRNNGPISSGHFNYIFGETRSGKYKSLGLTTSPKEKYPTIKLNTNPNPEDTRTSYIKIHPITSKKEYMVEISNGSDWNFSEEDWGIVRGLIKRYKKSTNRRPKK